MCVGGDTSSYDAPCGSSRRHRMTCSVRLTFAPARRNPPARSEFIIHLSLSAWRYSKYRTLFMWNRKSRLRVGGRAATAPHMGAMGGRRRHRGRANDQRGTCVLFLFMNDL